LKATYKKFIILSIYISFIVFLFYVLINSKLFLNYKDYDSSNVSVLQVNNSEVIYCNSLSYENAVKHDFKNLSKIDIRVLNNKEWNENLFRAYISLEQNNKIISPRYKNKQLAKVSFIYEDSSECVFNAKVRIHGDYEDHIHEEQGIVKSSLDVELMEGNVGGVTKFKLFLPETRNSENEIFVTTILNKLSILSPRTRFLDTTVNEVAIKYLLQEKISKEFLEINSLREGPVIEYYENMMWESRINEGLNIEFFSKVNNVNFLLKNINNFSIGLNGIALLNSISKNASFSLDNQEIENIQLDYNSTQTSDKLNRFDAALLSLGSTHGLISHNRKFYYDPLFNSLIPIYYDGLSGITEDQGSSWITPYLQTSVNVESIQNGSKSLLKDFKSLKSKNLEIKTELESYGYIISESKLNELFDKFEKHLTIIKNFDNTNQIEIRTKPIEYSLQKSYFEIINDEIYYCYYESCSKIKISETKSILNNEFKKDNIQIYLVQTHESKTNKVQKIEVADLSILVFGEPELKIDKENKIININLKKLDEKIVFYDSNMIDWKINVDHVQTFSTTNIRNDKSLLTGCITFNNIFVSNLEIQVKNSFCEDSINFINSSGNIKSMIVINSNFDGVDLDFSNLNIEYLNIINSKNDCLDLSYGDYTINQLENNFCGDKGISVGENSNLTIKDTVIKNSNIGIAVKDSSVAYIEKLTSINNSLCISLFQKKQEFGPAKARIGSSNCLSDAIHVEKGSLLIEN
jgi:hypothetical protein